MLLRIIFQAFPNLDPPAEPTAEDPPLVQTVLVADPNVLLSPAQYQFFLGQVSGAVEIVAAQGVAVLAKQQETEAAKPKVYVPGFVKP